MIKKSFRSLFFAVALMTWFTGSTVVYGEEPPTTPAEARATGSDIPAVFDLESAVQRGLEANPRVEAYEYGVEAAENRVKSTRGQFLPSVSATSGVRRLGNRSAEEFDQDYLDQDTMSYGLRVSQPLFAGFRILNSWRKAGLEAEVSEARLRMQQLDLTHRIQVYFLELLRIREDLRAARGAVERLETQLKAAEAWFKVEMRPRLEVLQTKAELEAARNRVVTVANAEQVLMTHLHVLLDLPRDRKVNYDDDLLVRVPVELPDAEFFFETARRQRPDLEMARKSVEIAEKDHSLTKGSFVPRVNLDAGYNYSDIDYRMAGRDDVERKYWTVGINAEWEFFSGGRDYYETKRAGQVLAAQQAQERETEQTIAAEVREALLGHADALVLIEGAREALEAAREAYDAAQSRYRAGVGTITDILNTQDQLTRAETDLNRAKAARFSAMADLYRAAGILNPDLQVSP
jgi:outer membrane protein